jgi:hypothetical protein
VEEPEFSASLGQHESEIWQVERGLADLLTTLRPPDADELEALAAHCETIAERLREIAAGLRLRGPAAVTQGIVADEVFWDE